MSPSRAATRPSGSRARSRSSIAALASTPYTSTCRSASGSASRPVPTASSRTRGVRPSPADARASSATTSAVTPASLMPGVPLVVDVGEGVAVRRTRIALHAPVLPQLAFSAVERLVYLDHAATTPMRPEAVEAMLPFLTERFANPSGSHRFARDARRAVDEARDRVAEVIGCRPGEVVFTGCGTESDNAAITGAVQRQPAVAPCARRPSTMPCCTPSSGPVGRSSRSTRRHASGSTRSPALSTPTSRSSA